MNILKSKWLPFLLIVLIGWLSLSFIKIKLQKNIVNKEIVELEYQVNDLEKDNDHLKKLLGELSSIFLEKETRIKLNYKAPDEHVAFVYPDDSSKGVSVSEDVAQKIKIENSPNYIKWWYWLMDN